MRPGRIRPGNTLVGVIQAPIGQASMRPGRIRPGNDAERLRQRQALAASMRPGRIRPGNRRISLIGTSWTRRFNEARADSPGKYSPYTPSRLPRSPLQ